MLPINTQLTLHHHSKVRALPDHFYGLWHQQRFLNLFVILFQAFFTLLLTVIISEVNRSEPTLHCFRLADKTRSIQLMFLNFIKSASSFLLCLGLRQARVILNLFVDLYGVSVDALRMPNYQKHCYVDKCLVGALGKQSCFCHIESEDLLVLLIEVEKGLEHSNSDVGEQDQPHRCIEEPPVGETCSS
jgi:hypothetical protein